MTQTTPYLIDWMTLRVPLGPVLGEALSARVRECLNVVHCVSSAGELLWEKYCLDLDALRSDTVGLCWMVQSDGKASYLVIGASPAFLEHGVNVFGSCDIVHCAGVLIGYAGRCLQAVLPGYRSWQCRRIDVTGNFALPSSAEVKQALRQLALADGGRRKASNNARGGDTVFWNATSDLVKGKAYHKGPQMARLRRDGKIDVSDELLKLADRLLRLEHTRGARWFRRLASSGRDWWSVTISEWEELYRDFFGRVVDGVEVKDMGRLELVKAIQEANQCTEGRALGAYHVYCGIRSHGWESMKESTPKCTWYRALKFLRAAGVSDVELQNANVVQFKPVRVVLAQPVMCWEDVRRVA